MTHILHRAANAVMPVAVSGSGIKSWPGAPTARRYLDASGGAAVSCLGHGHPGRARRHAQAARSARLRAYRGFTTEAAERLADRLIEDAPAGLDRVYLVSGGSEAIEAALKMARQYFVEIGEPERRHIVASRQSYHGNTLRALAASGNAWRRAQFEPLLIKTHHIDPCYAYRLQRRARATRIMRRGPLKRSRTSLSKSARKASSPSRRDRGRGHSWSRAPVGDFSSASGRSASATACCSSSTK